MVGGGCRGTLLVVVVVALSVVGTYAAAPQHPWQAKGEGLHWTAAALQARQAEVDEWRSRFAGVQFLFAFSTGHTVRSTLTCLSYA